MVDGKEECEFGCLHGETTGDDGNSMMIVEAGQGQTQIVTTTMFWQTVRSEVSRIFSFNPVMYAQQLGLKLHVRGLGDSKETRLWFEGRKKENPGSFSVFVMDNSGNPFLNPFTTSWKVTFHAIGGNKVELRPEDLTGLHESPLIDGVAEIDMADMVFKQVTSKCGDFCQVVARLSAPAELVGVVGDWVSDHIKVISGRCKNSRKRSWDELSPEDGVQQVKSVGDVLANRFVAAGYKSVRSIAGINLGPGDRHPPEDLLKTLQDSNTNSPFTATKLVELIKNSRQVVAKDSGQTSPQRFVQSPREPSKSDGNCQVSLGSCESSAVPSQPCVQAPSGPSEWTTFVDLSILDGNGNDYTVRGDVDDD